MKRLYLYFHTEPEIVFRNDVIVLELYVIMCHALDNLLSVLTKIHVGNIVY